MSNNLIDSQTFTWVKDPVADIVNPQTNLGVTCIVYCGTRQCLTQCVNYCLVLLQDPD